MRRCNTARPCIACCVPITTLCVWAGPRPDEEILQLFRDDLASAGIQDAYQRDLYLQAGTGTIERVSSRSPFRAPARSSAHGRMVRCADRGHQDWRANRPNRSRTRRQRGIVDYKTGKARSQEDADDSLQLSIYAMAAHEKWGYRVSELAFHNLEGNVPVVSKRTEFQLEQARERVLAVARNIADGNSKPKPDFHCNFCAFRGLCPAREKRTPNRCREYCEEHRKIARLTTLPKLRQTSAKKLRGRFRRPPFLTSY